jgi:dUTP pyrophosphatase
MKRVAMFEKVSFEQFKKDWIKTFGENWLSEMHDNSIENLEEVYENIKIPRRSSVGSAGNDFFAPIKFILEPKKTIKLPTGIRCYIEQGWVLKCYPRSSLGFNYRLQLDNSVGIIDQDYYYSDNEGHIFVKLTNDSKDDINEEKVLRIDQGKAIFQGIFVQYGITMDDVVEEIRNGGIGSSDKK